jgi:hypothetical protein
MTGTSVIDNIFCCGFSIYIERTKKRWVAAFPKGGMAHYQEKEYKNFIKERIL